MMTTFIEKIVGDLGDKRRWRQYKARVKRFHDLPHDGRGAGAVPDVLRGDHEGDLPMDVLMSMLGDLADLFQQAAADQNPDRAVVGEDPVEFAETFFRNYSDSQWINRERDRSVSAIEREISKEIQRGFNKEQGRLVKAIERAEAQDGATRS